MTPAPTAGKRRKRKESQGGEDELVWFKIKWFKRGGQGQQRWSWGQMPSFTPYTDAEGRREYNYVTMESIIMEVKKEYLADSTVRKVRKLFVLGKVRLVA